MRVINIDVGIMNQLEWQSAIVGYAVAGILGFAIGRLLGCENLLIPLSGLIWHLVFWEVLLPRSRRPQDPDGRRKVSK
jgi:hypothetical protein